MKTLILLAFVCLLASLNSYAYLGQVPAASGSSGGSVTVSANTAGSYSKNTVGASAVAITAPANSVGFMIQSDKANTTNNCRWAIGATASATNGSLLQPGQSFDNVPVAATISVFCVDASQIISVQWFLTH